MNATATELLERLVGFDTVSARSNLALIDFAEAWLTRAGARCVRAASPDGAKANLVATIGPAIDGGLALSGHSDVVPVEGQPWTSDPFALVPRGGRLQGRGTADMKGFLAVAMALAPGFAAASLARPVHLCFSYDEEVGCLGAPRMLEMFGRTLPRPALAIIGEPTSMRVVNAHKGANVYETTIVGRAAHSSAPHRGASAIRHMARFMTFLDSLAATLHARGEAGATAGLEFDPPWTTLNMGVVRGGAAFNIVAQDCALTWDLRALPGVDVAAIESAVEAWVATELRPALARDAAEAHVGTRRVVAVPALRPEPGGVAEALCLALTGANRAATVAFGSEGGQFQDAGLSTVMCGPGDIADAHRPDESIDPAQLAACGDFLRRLVARVCA